MSGGGRGRERARGRVAPAAACAGAGRGRSVENRQPSPACPEPAKRRRGSAAAGAAEREDDRESDVDVEASCSAEESEPRPETNAAAGDICIGVFNESDRFRVCVLWTGRGAAGKCKDVLSLGVWDSAEDAARWRDRYLIAAFGPDSVGPKQTAARRLNFGLAEYEDEPFYKVLFGTSDPPRVGVHDLEGGEGAWARLREWMRSISGGASAPPAHTRSSSHRVTDEPSPPAKSSRQHSSPAAGPEERKVAADGDKRKHAEPPSRTRSTSRLSADGPAPPAKRQHSSLAAGASSRERSQKAAADHEFDAEAEDNINKRQRLPPARTRSSSRLAEAADLGDPAPPAKRQLRSAAAAAAQEKAAAAGESSASEYEPDDDGESDADSDSDDDSDSGVDDYEEASAGDESDADGDEDAEGGKRRRRRRRLNVNVGSEDKPSRVGCTGYMGVHEKKGRFYVLVRWPFRRRTAESKIQMCVGIWERAEDAARWRDRYLIALFGPDAVGPDKGVFKRLNFDLSGYKAEPFYKALFGSKNPPRVGVRAPKADKEPLARLRDWMRSFEGGPNAPPSRTIYSSRPMPDDPAHPMNRRRSAANAAAEEPAASDAEVETEGKPRPRSGNPSGYLGVYHVPQFSRFRARVYWTRAKSECTKFFTAGAWGSAEDAARWRDRYLIAMLGPDAFSGSVEPPGRRLNFKVAEFKDEPFYRALFGSKDPPRVGVHDPERNEGAFVRLRDWMISIDANASGLPAVEWRRPRQQLPLHASAAAGGHDEERAPARQRGLQSRSAAASAAEQSNVNGETSLDEGGTRPTSCTSLSMRAEGYKGVAKLCGADGKRDRFIAKMNCYRSKGSSGKRGRSHLGVWESAEEAARWRDRYMIAIHGPDAVGPDKAYSAWRGLNFDLREYQGEPFYKALFGSTNPPRVGVHDPENGNEAFARLRDWMRSINAGKNAKPAQKRGRLHQPQKRNHVTGFYGVKPSHARFGSVVAWLGDRKSLTRNWTTAEEAARHRDRLCIACYGPETAHVHNLNFPLAEYEGESFYKALFGKGAKARVGVRDTQLDKPSEAIARLKAFMEQHGVAPVDAPLKRRKGTAVARKYERSPDSGLFGVYASHWAPGGKGQPTGFTAYVPLRGIRFKSTWEPSQLQEAGRWRDRLLIAIKRPSKAAKLGLNHPLAEYEGEPWYRRLFGGEGGDPPPIGFHDPVRRTHRRVAARRAMRFIAKHGGGAAPAAGASSAAQAKGGDPVAIEQEEGSDEEEGGSGSSESGGEEGSSSGSDG